MGKAKNLHNPSYIICTMEQLGRAVRCTLARYHSSLKIKKNNLVFLVFMEYVPDVELFCDPLKVPSVPSGDLDQLAQSSPMVPTEGAGTCFGSLCQGGISRVCLSINLPLKLHT